MVQDVLKSNRISYIDRVKEQYKTWKSNEGEEKDVQVVGKNYVDDEKKDKLYEDLIETGL
jgi:F0F1-type ATP synthase delta subunit